MKKLLVVALMIGSLNAMALKASNNLVAARVAKVEKLDLVAAARIAGVSKVSQLQGNIFYAVKDGIGYKFIASLQGNIWGVMKAEKLDFVSAQRIFPKSELIGYKNIVE